MCTATGSVIVASVLALVVVKVRLLAVVVVTVEVSFPGIVLSVDVILVEIVMHLKVLKGIHLLVVVVEWNWSERVEGVWIYLFGLE